MSAEVIPVVDPAKCGMCKGTGNLPGVHGPEPCPHCTLARKATAEAEKVSARDRIAEAGVKLDDLLAEMIRCHNEWAKRKTAILRGLIAEVENIKSISKGGK